MSFFCRWEEGSGVRWDYGVSCGALLRARRDSTRVLRVYVFRGLGFGV